MQQQLFVVPPAVKDKVNPVILKEYEELVTNYAQNLSIVDNPAEYLEKLEMFYGQMYRRYYGKYLQDKKVESYVKMKVASLMMKAIPEFRNQIK